MILEPSDQTGNHAHMPLARTHRRHVPNTTLPSQLPRWLDTILNEPLDLLPDDLVAHARMKLPDLLMRLNAGLGSGASPEEVIAALECFATRRGLPLPELSQLMMDVDTICQEMPADLFRLAYRRLWSSFVYRRVPGTADFKAAVAAELKMITSARAHLELGIARLDVLKLRYSR